MSITTKFILRKSKVNRDGEYPIYIRVTKDRVSRFFATGVVVNSELWDNNNKQVKRGHPNSVRTNNLLYKKYTEI